MPRKTKSQAKHATNTNELAQPIAIETATKEDFKKILDEIKGYDGVIGFILRNATSATIDLKDPSKLIEYAVLSSSALDAAEELSELFGLGNIDNILVEGKEAKVLSMTTDENRISIFFEKNAEIEKTLKKLRKF